MDNQQLLALLREWFDNHSPVELTGQRDEYYYCHSCKQSAYSLKGIRHTEDCLLVRTEKALYPMMVVKKE